MQLNDPLLVLRAGTSQLHKNIEQLPIFASLLKEKVSIQNYQVALQLFSHFYTIVEPLVIQGHIQLPYSPRLPALHQDLTALKINDQPKAFAFSLQNDAERLGCRYVIEGSALGAQILLKHLSAKFHGNHPSFCYLKAQIKTIQDWPAFQVQLRISLNNDDKIQHALNKAKETFGLLTALHQDIETDQGHYL